MRLIVDGSWVKVVGAHIKEVAVGGDIHKPVNVFIAAVVVVEI